MEKQSTVCPPEILSESYGNGTKPLCRSTECSMSDARKEFSMISRIGFGVDGSTRQRDFDFEQVRGEFENDAFVKMVCKHIEDKTALGNELIGRLETLMTSMPQH